jgi:predicted nucleotide-binding protein
MERHFKSFIDALFDFQCMARNRRQMLVIRFFLEQIIKRSELCEDGSILLYVPPPEDSNGEGQLWVCSAHDDFTSLESFGYQKKMLGYDQGIAALAFRKRSPEFASEARKHPQFYTRPGQPETDIGQIYCVPIQLPDQRAEPFGVVAFHNKIGSEKIIDAASQRQMDVAVKSLEAMLSLSPRKLADRNRVFIVHGRNEPMRQQLEDILKEEGIVPVVIQRNVRTGEDLLGTLERQIRGCLAGFILLTPDDEGRLYEFGEPLRQRARQNVIFEGGYLTALFRDTQRICFVQQGDLEIPSDLNGLLMEKYGERIDAGRIKETLKKWGFSSKSKDRETSDTPSGGKATTSATKRAPAPEAPSRLRSSETAPVHPAAGDGAADPGDPPGP